MKSGSFFVNTTRSDLLKLKLIGAPLGMHFSENTDSIEWTPDLDHVGELKFSIMVTDGSKTYYKTLKLNVIKPSLLSKYIVNPGATILVENVMSILNGSHVSVPVSSYIQEVSIYEWRDSNNNDHFQIKSNFESVDPIFIEFHKEMDITEDSSSNLALGWFDEFAGDVENKVVRAVNYTTCFTSDVVLSENHLNAKYAHYFDGPKGIVQIYKDKAIPDNDATLNEIVSSPYLEKAFYVSNAYSLKIYLTFDDRDTNNSPGLTPRSSRDYIILNVKKLKEIANPAYISHTLVHEAFHVYQNRQKSCGKKPAWSSSFKSLVEGSAEYVAESNLSLSELSDVFYEDKYYGNYISESGDVQELDYLKLADDTIGKGIFKIDAYNSSLLWEVKYIPPQTMNIPTYYLNNTNVNPYTFFDYLKNIDTFKFASLTNNYGASLFRDYLKSIGIDVKTFFLTLTDRLYSREIYYWGTGSLSRYFESFGGSDPLLKVKEYPDTSDTRVNLLNSSGSAEKTFTFGSLVGSHKVFRVPKNDSLSLNQFSMVSINHGPNLAAKMYTQRFGPPNPNGSYNRNVIFANKDELAVSPNQLYESGKKPDYYNQYKGNSLDYIFRQIDQLDYYDLHLNIFNVDEKEDQKVDVKITPLCRYFHRTQTEDDIIYDYSIDSFKIKKAFTLDCGQYNCNSLGVKISFCLYNSSQMNNYCYFNDEGLSYFQSKLYSGTIAFNEDPLFSDVLICQTKFPDGVRINSLGQPTYNFNFREGEINNDTFYYGGGLK